MSEAEAKLAALWGADAAPARDSAFRVAVLARLERRRVRDRVFALAAYGVLGAALIWFAVPQLSLLAARQQTPLTIAMSIVALVWAAFATMGRRNI